MAETLFALEVVKGRAWEADAFRQRFERLEVC
jgi:hypothetical protein